MQTVAGRLRARFTRSPRPRLLRVLLVVAGLLAAAFLALIWVARGPFVIGPLRKVPAGSPPSVARLRDAVDALCGAVPRSYRRIENLDHAAAWLEAELRKTLLEVEMQPYDLREGHFRNILATRRGTDPGAGVVIVGAHYDAYMDVPGADDNASGVAVLLELARTLPPEPSRRTLVLAFFTNEEPPFFGGEDMGSRRLVRKVVADGTDVHLMIALDCVGVFSDEPGSQAHAFGVLELIYPTRGDFVAVVGDTRAGRWIGEVKRGMARTGALPVVSFRAPASLPGVDWSDHMPFRDAGLPGVLVTDTAYLRTPHYHRRTDLPSTLDFDRMARVVTALHGALREAGAE